MGQGILLSAAAEVDFMVHGLFPYEFFGHTVWITTTHVCLLIVVLALIVFSIILGKLLHSVSLNIIYALVLLFSKKL